jgi:hypothetical protein
MLYFALLSLMLLFATISPTASLSTLSHCRLVDLSSFFASAGTRLIQLDDPNNDVSSGHNSTLLEIRGFVTMLDACSFQVNNFSVNFVPSQTYWYGKLYEDDASRRLVTHEEVVVASSNDDVIITYNMIDGITFETFDTLVLYSRSMDRELAYATFPKKTTVDSQVSSPSPSNTSETSMADYIDRHRPSHYLVALLVTVIVLVIS